MRTLLAQLRAELTMLFTNGESVFLTLGIPVVFLLFFSAVRVLPVGTPHPVDFLVPGILALAVMSTSMTALSIGTGFERGYGVLKRLGSTPLGRPRLLAAKIVAVIGVEILQAGVLVAVGYALGWNPGGPDGSGACVGQALGAMVLGTVAFGGIGLVLAGTLKPLVNLAVVNALFVILLLLGGMLIPLSKLPTCHACCRPPPWPRPSTTRSDGASASRAATGWCWRSGRWSPLSSPPSSSAGSDRGPAETQLPPTSRLTQLSSCARVRGPSTWPTTVPDSSMKNVLG